MISGAWKCACCLAATTVRINTPKPPNHTGRGSNSCSASAGISHLSNLEIHAEQIRSSNG